MHMHMHICACALACTHTAVAAADYITVSTSYTHESMYTRVCCTVQDHLAASKLTLLLVSHDQHFLNAVATDIILIEAAQLHCAPHQWFRPMA